MTGFTVTPFDIFIMGNKLAIDHVANLEREIDALNVDATVDQINALSLEIEEFRRWLTREGFSPMLELPLEGRMIKQMVKINKLQNGEETV